MSINKLILLFFICICTNELSSQRLALYAPKEEFSLSFIEKALLDLENNASQKILKDGVININDMLSTVSNSAQTKFALRKLFNYKSLSVDSINAKIQETGKVIGQYEYFLQANINQFKNYIEYRFILYQPHGGKIDPSEKKISVAIFNDQTPVKALKNIIINALKEFFPDAHASPFALIDIDEKRLNGKIIDVRGDSINAAAQETIFLNARATTDSDTPYSELEFRWRRIYPENTARDLNLILLANYDSCQVAPKVPGHYMIELSVYDGVERTKYQAISKDTIIIKSYKKPVFAQFPKTLKSYSIDEIIIEKELYSNSRAILISNVIPNSKIQPVDKNLRISILKNSRDTIIAKFHYLNEKTKKEFELYLEAPSGIKVKTELKIHHKRYSPYSLSLYWTYNSFNIDKKHKIESNTQSWYETRIMLHGKIRNKLQIGFGWAFQERTWQNTDGISFKLKPFGELELSYNLISRNEGNLGLAAFGKIYQVNTPNNDLFPTVFGFSAHADIVLLQGLGVLSLKMGIGAFNDPTFYERNSFSSWFGFGIKGYIPY